MDLEDSESIPVPVPAPPPFALAYGTPASRSPALVTVMAIIGICIAVFGFITAAFGALSVVSAVMMRRAMPAMQWQTSGATAVSICETVIGAALAATLLAGSIGMLRLRPWSRRILLWWGWVYILTDLLFLALQILIVVPSQVSGFTNIMNATPPAIATTMPNTGVVAPTTSTAVSATSATGGGTSTTAFFPAAAAGGPPPAQMMAGVMSGMRLAYVFMAVGKAAVCLVFPIVILAIMRINTVRTALAA